jgi:hypothetical protein
MILEAFLCKHKASQDRMCIRNTTAVSEKVVCGANISGIIWRGADLHTSPRKIRKHTNKSREHLLTLSIPSYSLPRLVPRVGAAVGAVLSSLPLADPVLRSRFLVEVTVAVMGFAAALRCAFISCLKFLESSRFSSLYLRKRS